MLTPETAGIENIPKGGIYIEENPIVEAIIQENTETIEQDVQDNIIIEEDNNRNGRDSENIPPYNIGKRKSLYIKNK